MQFVSFIHKHHVIDIEFFFFLREPNPALYSAVILKYNAGATISCPASVHSSDKRKCFIEGTRKKVLSPQHIYCCSLWCSTCRNKRVDIFIKLGRNRLQNNFPLEIQNLEVELYFFLSYDFFNCHSQSGKKVILI